MEDTLTEEKCKKFLYCSKFFFVTFYIILEDEKCHTVAGGWLEKRMMWGLFFFSFSNILHIRIRKDSWKLSLLYKLSDIGSGQNKSTLVKTMRYGWFFQNIFYYYQCLITIRFVKKYLDCFQFNLFCKIKKIQWLTLVISWILNK